MIALLAALLATVPAAYTPPSYACDGVTTVYTVTFPYLASADVKVTSTTAGQVTTTLVLTTDYTLSVTSTATTALVTLAAGSRCPAGSTLKIARIMSCSQPTNLRTQGQYLPATHELMFDRAIMCMQQVQAQLSGAQPTVNFGLANTWTATQTFTPTPSNDALVVTISSGSGRGLVVNTASGTAVQATAGTTGRGISAIGGITSGVAGQFDSGNTNNGAIRIVGMTNDPVAPADGEVWLNLTQQTAKMRINGTTNVFLGQPSVSVNSGTGGGGPFITGTTNVVVFGSVLKNFPAGSYSTATGEFTVPAGRGGDYYVSSCVSWNNANASIGILQIDVAGIVQMDSISSNYSALESTCVSGVVQAAAAQLIDVRVFQSSGSNQALTSTTSDNWMVIRRLGD